MFLLRLSGNPAVEGGAKLELVVGSELVVGCEVVGAAAHFSDHWQRVLKIISVMTLIINFSFIYHHHWLL